MKEPFTDSDLVRKVRVLSQGLIISLALNMGFLATFFIMASKNHKQEIPMVTESFKSDRAVSYISSDALDVLSEYFDTPYEKLLMELENTQFVEDGYAKRDYALACLVAFHCFDVHKALSGTILRPRVLEFVHKEGGERVKLELFPGLHNEHFEALRVFAKLEKWPFTPQGLYAHLHRFQENAKVPSSLKEAFYLTPQFQCLWRLFNRWEKNFSSEDLLGLASGIEWEDLDGLYREVQVSQEFSEEHRRRFLTLLLTKKSSFAAKVFLEYDREFALTKLDDQNILYLLTQVTSQTSKADILCRQLLLSIRGDAVHRSAAAKLYELAGEAFPQPYDHEKALLRFLPNFFQKNDFIKPQEVFQNTPPPKAPLKRYHVVVKGDTLWKIAADHHLSLQDLLKVNHLTHKSVIKPGMKLELP